MPGQTSVLDETFVVNQANGISRYTAVVQGPNDNECAYGAAGAGQFLGITQEDQDDSMPINVRMLGTSWAKAVGPITKGVDICIGDANGSVDDVANHTTPVAIGKALSTAAAAGDTVLVFIKP